METLRGGCHCRNITLELEWPAEAGSALEARACTCTFCTRHGAAYISNPRARLRARVAEPQALSRYTFGTRTAEFFICARCGVAPFVTSIDGRLIAVVNVHTLDGIEPARIRTSPISFDGEEVADRLARRERGWIGDVVVEEGAAPTG